MQTLFENLIVSDPKVLAAMFAVLGTVGAAVMSSAGYLFRAQTDQKKSLRKVLYLLLELRYAVLVRLFDPDVVTREYISHSSKRLSARGLESNPDEVPAAYLELISTHFRNLGSSLRTEIDERLLTPFEDALLEMATIAPALAYQLRGREKLECVIGHTRQYQSQVSSLLASNIQEPLLKVMQDTSSDIKEEALEDLSKLLDRDVLMLAKACGRRDYRACKRIIKHGPSLKQQLDFDAIDALIDQVFDKLTTATAASGQKLRLDGHQAA